MERAESKTILELLHYAGKQEATSKDAQVVGDRAADIWRTVLPDDPPAKVEQVEDGETIWVNTYPREFWPVVLNIILEYYTNQEATPQRPFARLKDLIGTAATIRPYR